MPASLCLPFFVQRQQPLTRGILNRPGLQDDYEKQVNPARWVWEGGALFFFFFFPPPPPHVRFNFNQDLPH